MDVQLATDIFYDVLLRLHVRALCKFRCVSKSWNILISNPSFVKSHIQLSMKRNHLLLFKKGRKLLENPSGSLDGYSLVRFMSYKDDERFCGIKPEFPKYLRRLITIRPFNQDNFSTRGGGGFMLRQHQNPFNMEEDGVVSIISCCRGLVLMCRCFRETTKLCLFNPVNSRISELPIISEELGSYYCSRYGLGYSNNSTVFKVVRFLYANHGCRCDVLVMNDSPTGERLYDDDLPILMGDGTLAGGNLFFETTDDVLLQFDVESNNVSLVNYPPGCDFHYSRGNFIEINGELGMSNRKDTCQPNVMEIWILKDKENSIWVNTYSIKMLSNEYMIMPIHFVDEDTWFIESSGSTFICNQSRSQFQEITALRLHVYMHCFYRENLSLVCQVDLRVLGMFRRVHWYLAS